MIALAKKLRQFLFLCIRRVSYAILRKLNPEYSGVEISEKREASHTVGNLVANTSRIQQTIVLNSDNASLNAEVLHFSLIGMGFTESEISYILGSVVSLDSEVTAWELSEKLEQGLKVTLAKEESIFHLNLMSKFLNHKKELMGNKRAYLPAGRSNPNAVFWPDPSQSGNRRSLFTELPLAKRTPLIDKTTKIVSAGSCFATEIAHYLINHGFNYLVTEGSGGAGDCYEVLDMHGKPNASAAWGIIFNTPSFRQLVEKAFDQRALPRILWSQLHKGENLYFDPFRENVAFRSIEAYERNYSMHTAAARKAFEEMDVFIITLGLNEVWSFSADGSVFSRSPWRAAPSLIQRTVLTVEENVSDLLKMSEILRRFNPKVKIICTVSPVPLHATFRADDHHVVVANAHSKAVLRVAAEEFVNRCPDSYYFPSYEIVMFCTENPWMDDQRHVSRQAVSRVMAAFMEMYVH
jgi:hypothetical protein